MSILIPTRGRPKLLTKTVDSLYSLATDKSNLEFIFKVDDDDSKTIETACWIGSLGLNCKTIVSPRGRGYLDLHVFVNQMCEVANGDWLLLMNDDARMTKEGWDHSFIENGPSRIWPGVDELCLLYFPTGGSLDDPQFVALRYQTYKLLGHFSLSTYCDNWIYTVMRFCGCIIEMPFPIEHHTGFITDKVDNEADRRRGIDNIFSMESMRLKVNDINKILDRIEWYNSRRVWTPQPSKYNSWMIWRENEEDYPKMAFVSEDGQVMLYGDGGNYLSKVSDMRGSWTTKE